MVGAVSIVFVVSHLVPSDPARLIAGPDAREAQLRQVVAEYHLDRPLPQQYATYLWTVFVNEAPATAIYTKRSVTEDLRHYFMATLAGRPGCADRPHGRLGTGIPAAVTPAVSRPRQLSLPSPASPSRLLAGLTLRTSPAFLPEADHG